MEQRNDGQNEVFALQNCFTAYLLVAIKRKRYDYLQKRCRLKCHEFSTDFQETLLANDSARDMLDRMPFSWQCENQALLSALDQLTARERYILLERVLNERSYNELGRSLGLRYNGTAAAYRRIIVKLRKKLGGDGE